MKTKKTVIASAWLKLLLFLTVIILMLVAFNSCAARKKSPSTKTEVVPLPPPSPPPAPPPPSQKPVPGQKDGDAYLVVEEMPVFEGGDTALLKYIAKNTRYPKDARDKNIQGKVITRFKVTEDGTVTDASVLRGVDPVLDIEALRVVSSLPKFTPGKQKGIPVPVWYMIPISFTLNNGPQRPSRFEVTGTDTVYNSAKEMPVFPGGNEAFKKFKADNLKYPPEVKSLGIEGIVFVRFIIEMNGMVSNVKIMQGASPALDAEAIRVTRSMPAWQPARENGKPVKFMSIVNFDFFLTPRTIPVPKEGEPFVVVEEMPMFPGGDSALLAYLAQNTKYPEAAKAKNIQGRVIVRFCVTDVGGIDKVTVLKGVDPELDAEAVRVVKTLPQFKPGKQGGKPVNVWYMVPITFGLSKPEVKTDSNLTPKAPPPPPPPPQGYDEAPLFPGGETAMYKFINSNLAYPASAKEKNISGKVLLSYCVGANGLIEQVNVIKGVAPELDAEAVRVIRLLPAWKPGKLSGTPVKVCYSTTVTFNLK